MAAFSTLALVGAGLVAGGLIGGAVGKKQGRNQTLQQQQTLAPAPAPTTLAQPTPPPALPTDSMAKQAGIMQRKRSGGGVNLAQPVRPRNSTMPVSGSGLAKPRTLLGY